MSLNIQTATGLLEIGGKVTKEKVISALEYVPANETHTKDEAIHVTTAEKETWNNKSDFSGAYADLDGAPSITETESGNMVIADESGNIIMQVDVDGLSTTNVNTRTIKLDGEDLGTRLDELESMSLPNILDNESDDLSIADEAGNVIVKINKDGLETTNVIAKDDVIVNGKSIVAKIDKYDEHIDKTYEHIQSGEREKWNNKSDVKSYADLPDAPDIVENESGEVVYADEAGNVIAKISENGLHTTAVKINESEITGVDSELSEVSVNPVQNRVIAAELGKLSQNISHPVTSVNNKTGDVVLTATDVGALPNTTPIPSIEGLATEDYVNDMVGKIDFPVDSVNGKTGAVNLAYSDIPNAPNIVEDNDGNMVVVDESGNIILRIDENGLETTTIIAKNIIATDFSGSGSGEENQNAYSSISIPTADGAGRVTLLAQSKEDELRLEAGENITLTSGYAFGEDGSMDNVITISADTANKADKSYVDSEIAEAKLDASNKDAVVLSETQKGISELRTYVDSNKEKTANKVTTISSSSTNTKYPSAKAVYDFVNDLVGDVQGVIDSINTIIG